MKAIVVGCGKVGSYLAVSLAEQGHEVTVIDRNPKAFRMLKGETLEGTEVQKASTPQSRIRCILGLGIDEDVLKEAGIVETGAFAAVTDSDYANIMAGLMAKDIFKVPRVITRISEPKQERIFRGLGLETICPTTLGAKGILDLLVKGETEDQSPK